MASLWVGPVLLAMALSPPPDPQASLLDNYDLSKDGGIDEGLPRELREVSGLATTPDGRLFAHNDEQAVIYQVDPLDGDVVKAFAAGFPVMRGDFEGIAYARGRFYLSTAQGELLEVEEGGPGAAMSYGFHSTGLGRVCEMEGLAYDAEEGSLLMPCKESPLRDLRDHLVVFSILLETKKPYLIPRVYLPLEELEAFGLDPEFHPSAIEVHPQTGSILIVAAREEAVIEVTSQGRLVAVRELRRKDHPQPEGVTFLPDGTLLLADEGQGNRSRLTRYLPARDRGGVKP